MSSKRNPQTAAKREREQAVKDKRRRKQEKKQAAAEASRNGTVTIVEDSGSDVESTDEATTVPELEQS